MTPTESQILKPLVDKRNVDLVRMPGTRLELVTRGFSVIQKPSFISTFTVYKNSLPQSYPNFSPPQQSPSFLYSYARLHLKVLILRA
jgi:hypothetical protein